MEKSIFEEAIANPGNVAKLLKNINDFDKDIDDKIELVLKILFGSQDFGNSMKIVQELKIPMGICGKTFGKSDAIYFCKTCEKAPNSCICQDCFSYSNHEGHQISLKIATCGVCDCGDSDAWQPSGFCSKHQGYDESLISIDLLPVHIRTVAQPVIHFLAKKLNYASLELKSDPKSIEKCNQIIEKIFATFSLLSDISGVFAKIICHELNGYCFANLPSDHKCNYRTFLSQEEEQNFPKQKEAKINNRKGKKGINEITVCECKVLENTIKCIHLIDGEILKQVCAYLTKMTKSPFLKEMLGYGLIANYCPLVVESFYCRQNDEWGIEWVSSQIFNLEEFSQKIFKREEFRKILLEVTDKLVEMIINWKKEESEDIFYRLYVLRKDIRYLTCPKTLVFVLNSTDFMQQLMTILAKIDFSPLYVPLTAHITQDYEAGFNDMLTTQECCFDVAKIFIQSIDYTDISFCRKIGLFFKSLIGNQLKKTKTWENTGAMYFTSLVPRLFYVFISSYLLVQLTITSTSPENLKNEIRGKAKMIITENGTVEELDQFIKDTLQISIIPVIFMIEIRAGIWKYYGELLQFVCQEYNKSKKFMFTYNDFPLIQLLIGMYESKNKEELLELIFKSSKEEDILSMLASPEKQESNKKPLLFILEGILHLICCLSSNNTIGMLPLSKIIAEAKCKYPFHNLIMEQTTKSSLNYFGKELAHFSMISPNTQFSYHLFEKTLPANFKQTKEMELMINNMCQQTKNAKGVEIFSLAPEKIGLFDPFYYFAVSDTSKSLEAIESVFNKIPDKKSYSGIFGGCCDGLKPLFNITSLFTGAIVNPNLLEIILSFILCKDKSNTTDMLILCSYKILYIYATANISLEQKKLIQEILKPRSKELIEEINQKMKTNQIFKHSFTNLAKALGNIDEGFLTLVNEKVDHEEKKDEKTERKLKQQKILEEYKKKQGKFFYSHASEVEKAQPKLENSINCVICGDDLVPEKYIEKPYGKLIFAEITTRLLQARKACIPNIQDLTIQEIRDMLDMKYTLPNGGGIKISSCNHYAHISCFVKLMETQGYKLFNTPGWHFPKGIVKCPLCRNVCISVIPDIIPTNITDSVKQAGETVCLPFINKIESGLSSLISSLKFLDIIQFNIQQVDMITSLEFFKGIDYLRSFIFHFKLNLLPFDPKEVEEVTTKEQQDSSTLMCDRARVLIDSLFFKFILSKNDGMLNSQDAVMIIEKEYKLHLYTIFLGILGEGKTMDIINFTPESLIKGGKAYLTKVIEFSIKFIIKAVCAFCTFCNVEKECQEKIKNILASEDIMELWNGINSGILPINFAQILEKLAFTEDKQVIESITKSPRFEYLPSIIKLITSKLVMKLFPIPNSYNEMIVKHYQKPCQSCGKSIKEKALCLACGAVFCLHFLEHDTLNQICDGHKDHDLVCQGFYGMYIRMSNGGIFLYYAPAYKSIDSPYVTKFGESMTVAINKEENFSLSPLAIKELENAYINDKLPQMFFAEFFKE